MSPGLLSVVLPCRDEAACVARWPGELFGALDALGRPWEAVAVDDGSRDATLAALRALALGRPSLKVLAHARGRGLGAALRTGFSAAAGDWIATLDADLTFAPAQLRGLLARQEETGADLVAGSPFLAAAGAARVPWRRRLPSLLLNACWRGLCGGQLTAYTPIFRLYRASALRGLRLESEGFEINAEIAARFLAAGLRVAEAPAVLTARQQGASKLSPLPQLWRHLRLAARLRRGAGPP